MLTALSKDVSWLFGVVTSVADVVLVEDGNNFSLDDLSEADDVCSSDVKLQSRPVMVHSRHAGRPSSH